MGTKYRGKITKIYSYGFCVQTDSGEIGTLKTEVIPSERLSELGLGSTVAVVDKGRRSVKGGILWDWNSPNLKSNTTPENTTKDNQVPVVNIVEISDSNLLSALFKGKDRDTSVSLLEDLSNNIYSINSESSYALALSLIEINRCHKPLLIKDLNHKLYIKANKSFKIKMWMDRLVRYCNFQEVLSLYKAQDPTMVKWLNNEFDFQNTIEIPTFNAPIVLESNIESSIIEKIDCADTSIHIAVAWFTNPNLLKALLKARKRGCEIILITNNDLINNGGYCLRLDNLIEAGGSIHLAEYPEMIHHKFAIFDEECVITGSYNWTIFAEHINKEDALLIEGEGMEATILTYISLFDRLKNEFEEIESMPDSVPDKPQYDRSSFKQYITEEVLFLAKRTRSPEKRMSFYQKALALSPNHPKIPEEYKSSAIGQNVARRSSVRNEVNRLKTEEEVISAQVEVTTKQITALRHQAQTLIETAPQSVEVVGIQDQIAELSRTVEINEQHIANLQAEQELLKTVSESNLQGSEGKFRVHLEWGTIDDLDLHLIIPDGQKIFYNNKTVNSNGCKGHLDVDANAGSNYSSSPQENIFWEDKAPEGRYRVNVHCYTYRSGMPSIPFVITVFSEGNEPITRTGVYSTAEAQARQTKTVIEFDFTRVNGITIL